MEMKKKYPIYFAILVGSFVVLWKLLTREEVSSIVTALSASVAISVMALLTNLLFLLLPKSVKKSYHSVGWRDLLVIFGGSYLLPLVLYWILSPLHYWVATILLLQISAVGGMVRSREGRELWTSHRRAA